MDKQANWMDRLLKKVVCAIVDNEREGWPPECSTLLYQPIRPHTSVNIQVSAEKIPQIVDAM